ncbi:unnamed protein product [Knipowitschia caucasica]
MCALYTDAECQLKEGSSQRIPRLTVKGREHCLVLLQEALCSHQGAYSSFDESLPLAVDLEHAIFKNSKTSNTYKASVLKKVSELKSMPVTSKGELAEAERKQDSKENQTADMPSHQEGEPSSSSSSSSSSSMGFTSASQVYSMKRKRVGAGLRGSSNPFQSARDLLSSTMGQSVPEPLADISGNSPALDSSVTSSIRARVSALNSPPNKVRALSKTQQKLADAAKNSRTISHYFATKETHGKQATESSVTLTVSDDVRLEHLPGLEDDVQKSPIKVEDEDVIMLSEEEKESVQEPPVESIMSAPELNNNTATAVTPPQEVKHKVKTQRAPSFTAKRNRPVEDRRVTFNPHIDERAVVPEREAPAAVTLKEAADIVVRCLDPFYSQGRFSTKELFKSFARFLSHLLTEGTTKGRGQIKAEAKALINKFFSKVQRCESEGDWKHLKRPAPCKAEDKKE